MSDRKTYAAAGRAHPEVVFRVHESLDTATIIARVTLADSEGTARGAVTAAKALLFEHWDLAQNGRQSPTAEPASRSPDAHSPRAGGTKRPTPNPSSTPGGTESGSMVPRMGSASEVGAFNANDLNTSVDVMPSPTRAVMTPDRPHTSATPHIANGQHEATAKPVALSCYAAHAFYDDQHAAHEITIPVAARSDATTIALWTEVVGLFADALLAGKKVAFGAPSLRSACVIEGVYCRCGLSSADTTIFGVVTRGSRTNPDVLDLVALLGDVASLVLAPHLTAPAAALGGVWSFLPVPFALMARRCTLRMYWEPSDDRIWPGAPIPPLHLRLNHAAAQPEDLCTMLAKQYGRPLLTVIRPTASSIGYTDAEQPGGRPPAWTATSLHTVGYCVLSARLSAAGEHILAGVLEPTAAMAPFAPTLVGMLPLFRVIDDPLDVQLTRLSNMLPACG